MKNIPGLISLYNEHAFTGGGFIAPMALLALPEDKKPQACLQCRSCEQGAMMSELSELIRSRKKGAGPVQSGDATGDLQKIDVGIALCHFVMGLEEQGAHPAVTIADPGISVPEDVEYIFSVQA